MKMHAVSLILKTELTILKRTLIYSNFMVFKGQLGKFRSLSFPFQYDSNFNVQIKINGGERLFYLSKLLYIIVWVHIL